MAESNVTAAERVALLHGPYRTPEVRIGRTVLVDEVRGLEVVVVGLTDARIPWPIGKPRHGRARAPVVFGDLERAVRLEANQAVCYWFGVTPQTVSKWRKALDVPQANEGTHRLHSIAAHEPGVAAGRAKAHAMQHDPKRDSERRQKIAVALAGRPKRWKSIQKMAKAKTGMKPTAETRQKLRESAIRRKSFLQFKHGRPWNAEEDEIVRNLPPRKAALKLGRLLGAVYARRYALKFPDGRRKSRPLT